MTVTTASRGAVLADLFPGARTRDITLVFSGAALTGLAAQVSISTPISPVPFTLQTFTALLVGGVLGSTRGVAAMLLYLAAGVLGIPWFAEGSHGLGGPSFGYIIGFVAAAALTGALASRGHDRKPLGTVGLMAAGNLVIYAAGATWLALSLHIDPATALALGVTPFLAADAVKIAAAAVLLPSAWRLMRRKI